MPPKLWLYCWQKQTIKKTCSNFVVVKFWIFLHALKAQFWFAGVWNLIPACFSLNWTQLGWCEVNFKHRQHTLPLCLLKKTGRAHSHTQAAGEKGARKSWERARVQFLFLTKEGLYPIMTLPRVLRHWQNTQSERARASPPRRRVDFSEIQFLAISLQGALYAAVQNNKGALNLSDSWHHTLSTRWNMSQTRISLWCALKGLAPPSARTHLNVKGYFSAGASITQMLTLCDTFLIIMKIRASEWVLREGIRIVSAAENGTRSCSA